MSIINNLKEPPSVIYQEDTALQIIRWGYTNAFPSTFKNMIDQSPNGSDVVNTCKEFVIGEPVFVDDNGNVLDKEVGSHKINSSGYTLMDLINSLGQNIAIYDGFAINVNYNGSYKVNRYGSLNMDTVRMGLTDTYNYSNKIGYYWDFSQLDELKKQVQTSVTIGDIMFMDRFNPEIVPDQVAQLDGNITKYNGQCYLYTTNKADIYPKPKLQAHINSLMADIDNETATRRASASGFRDSYIWKTTETDTKVLQEMEDILYQMQGVENEGAIAIMSSRDPDFVKNTVLEKLGDSNATRSKVEVITQMNNNIAEKFARAYSMPPLLVGLERSTGFSTDIMEQSYQVYNSITAKYRKAISDAINQINEYAEDEAGFNIKFEGKLQLNPKTLIV